MKKATFLLIGILYSITCLSQRVVSLSNIVTVEFPRKAEKINKTQALSHASKKFKNDKMVLGSIAERNTATIYKVDDVLISLFIDNHAVKEEHLSDIKIGLDEFSKGDSTYTSSLRKVNNNSVVDINYLIGNVGYYHLFCSNVNFTKAVTGIIEFNKTEKNKATVILDHILNSITFKE